jgi:hypothetical protein
VVPVAASGSPPEDGLSQLDSMVREYMHDHPGVARRAAIAAVCRENPEAHTQYLLAIPKNRRSLIRGKIQDRAESMA